mgnify:CR=1 FL=1
MCVMQYRKGSLQGGADNKPFIGCASIDFIGGLDF